MKAHERETEGRENRWRNWTSPLLTEGNSAVLLYPSSWSCISRWAFLCIYQWTKFWLRGPCSSFQGNLGKCQFCPPFFSSCLIFARLTLFSSLLPQPYFLLHFSIHFSPGYSTFIPYFRKKKMTIFSYYGPISVPLGIKTELCGDSLSFYLPSFTGSKASAMSPSA